MKKYLIDDSGIEVVDGIQCKRILSIIHWESIDLSSSEIPLEQITWSRDRILAELTMGDGIHNVPGIELKNERVYPDGRVETIQQFHLDPVAAYGLYLHLKKVDEENPDNVFW